MTAALSGPQLPPRAQQHGTAVLSATSTTVSLKRARIRALIPLGAVIFLSNRVFIIVTEVRVDLMDK